MKKNLLISIYDMEIGGIERSLINMLEIFDYDAYHVDLLIFEHRGDFMNLIPGQVNVLPPINPYSVFRKPIVQCLKEGHYALAAVRLLGKFAAFIKSKFKPMEEGPGYHQMQYVMKYSMPFVPKIKKKYDLAISYAWPHDIIAKKVDAKLKAAWVHTDYSKLEIDNKMDLEIWHQFDFIASVSEECTNSFLLQYPSLRHKISTIENITSPEFIKNMAQQGTHVLGEDEHAFNLLSVGRLSYVKGFDMAVKALKILHDRGLTNICWHIIGYGGYEGELFRLIQECGLEDSFLLLGKQANPYPYMKECDLYVQPSRYEGKAVTVTEAKILAKPVLITQYPTACSQVEDGVDGIICGLGAEHIADGIERLYHNEMLRNQLINNLKHRDFSNTDELEKLYAFIGERKRSRGVV